MKRTTFSDTKIYYSIIDTKYNVSFGVKLVIFTALHCKEVPKTYFTFKKKIIVKIQEKGKGLAGILGMNRVVFIFLFIVSAL